MARNENKLAQCKNLFTWKQDDNLMDCVNDDVRELLKHFLFQKVY